jgi:hypothetical protein
MATKPIDFNYLPEDSRVFLAEGSSEAGLLRAIVSTLQVDRAYVHDVKGEKY